MMVMVAAVEVVGLHELHDYDTFKHQRNKMKMKKERMSKDLLKFL